MKKNLEKIFASASIVVAVILIMILLITAFGGIKVEEFKSDLVRGLFITLAILYLLLSVLALVLMFVRSDVVKDVVVKSEKGGALRVSVKVINMLVKQCCAEISGVKCKKVALVQDDYGVRLKVNIKVVDKSKDEAQKVENVKRVDTSLRALLEKVFDREFGFKFMAIETKLMVMTPKAKADMDKLKAVVSEENAEICRAQEEEGAQEEQETVAEEGTAAEEQSASQSADVVEESENCSEYGYVGENEYQSEENSSQEENNNWQQD